ncbi:hypothetical protein OESDEN_14416 [Oesophagostomum dentatum]|uniref:Uncharacterized protein n=1 Tax=Oesophagostomum dentatum TaxID=61180 RepID=A0A0B1SKI5_OESDE|nr:hypothetical protein OESDEN_14416 [Oesophagostomum dentatum]
MCNGWTAPQSVRFLAILVLHDPYLAQQNHFPRVIRPSGRGAKNAGQQCYQRIILFIGCRGVVLDQRQSSNDIRDVALQVVIDISNGEQSIRASEHSYMLIENTHTEDT